MFVEKLDKIDNTELLNYENEFYGTISEGLPMLISGEETIEGMEQCIHSIIETLLLKQKQILRMKIENAILRHPLGDATIADVVYSVDI